MVAHRFRYDVGYYKRHHLVENGKEPPERQTEDERRYVEDTVIILAVNDKTKLSIRKIHVI